MDRTEGFGDNTRDVWKNVMEGGKTIPAYLMACPSYPYSCLMVPLVCALWFVVDHSYFQGDVMTLTRTKLHEARSATAKLTIRKDGLRIKLSMPALRDSKILVEKTSGRRGRVVGGCVYCHTGSADILVTPCGHVIVCENCGKARKQFRKCPVCHTKVERCVKMYLQNERT
ncbi:hypothetical protein RvY_15194 [Ramazzottius varieornatus]|uniref:RING-type domain-containing protein n=1 Tax=Ramazzottius varieornatus TaxID=947166 RepID=A0A1D1VU15_RAMVA|nr:hypothetical protein RvY_15194 [Ramazzottius varieornatus]